MNDSKLRILITDNLSDAGLAILQESPELEIVMGSPENVREQLQEVDGVIIRSGTKLTAEVLAGQPRLKVIVRAGVGVDNVDLDAATREGIIVMNTPAGNTTSTAEHAFALMASLSRNIPQAAATMKAGGWDRSKYTGSQLAGKTLAVIGLGRIGLTLARRALAFEMKVIGYDPFLSEERAREFGIELYREVDDVIDKCDYLSVHTPLTEETRGLINAERMQRMRPGARIINCARGGIVDEADLIAAVRAGTIAGAALDVYPQEPPAKDDPIRGVDNIITTPHLGASTAEAQESVAVEAAEIISAFLVNNEVRHAINMAPISGPELQESRAYLDLGYRLGLLQTQLLKQRFQSAGIQEAKIAYRGEVSEKKTRLITSAYIAGLLSSGAEEPANIINAESIARERGIQITESSSREAGDFTSIVTTTLVTDNGEFSVSGTIFGDRFLRLVRLDGFHLDAYLDGQLLIFRHQDKPGLIGFIGTVCGNHGVNISHMSLGREDNGGEAIAVLNLDSVPSKEAAEEVLAHAAVTGVELVTLPPSGEPLPWLDSAK
ncbi:MAG: phosphoglycerate dehydrogenase [Planctomycetota bacterium]|nr:phosphoglycerate dehydrogenase [Planctomycetota bacterium]